MAEDQKPTEPMQMPITEPTEPTIQQTGTEGDDILAILDKLNVKTPKDIEGMALASKQSGRLAQMVGELRNELRERDRHITELVQRNKPQAQDDYYPGQTQGSGIDIRTLVKDSIREVYRDDIVAPQQQVQQAFQKQMGAIRNDRYYDLLKKPFGEKLQDPDTAFDLQSGSMSIGDLYMNMKMDFIEEMLGKVGDNYKQLLEKGVKPTKASIPHMETGSSTNYVQPGQKPETKEQLKTLREKARGTDDDIDAMLRVILPDGDPILRRGQ